MKATKAPQQTTTATTPGNWHRMMSAVLLPNQAARFVREEPGGGVMLAVPTKKPGFLFPPISWVIRPPKERLTELDPIGASIWRACDGTQSVETLTENFALEHQLSFHESRVSVTGYVKMLILRGALAVSLEEAD